MDLAGKYVVVWLSADAIETFLGVLESSRETAMTSWTVAGQVVGESGPGLWIPSVPRPPAARSPGSPDA